MVSVNELFPCARVLLRGLLNLFIEAWIFRRNGSSLTSLWISMVKPEQAQEVQSTTKKTNMVSSMTKIAIRGSVLTCVIMSGPTHRRAVNRTSKGPLGAGYNREPLSGDGLMIPRSAVAKRRARYGNNRGEGIDDWNCNDGRNNDGCECQRSDRQKRNCSQSKSKIRRTRIAHEDCCRIGVVNLRIPVWCAIAALKESCVKATRPDRKHKHSGRGNAGNT